MSILFVKLIGCLMILSASAAFTVSYKKTLNSTRFSAHDLLKFVHFTQNAVQYRSLPVTRIIEEYTNETHDIFKEFYILASNSSLSDAISARNDIDEQTRNIMLAFSGEFGHGYTDAEISLCEITAARLSEHCTLLDKTVNKKSAVFISVITFLSVSIILILI